MPGEAFGAPGLPAAVLRARRRRPGRGRRPDPEAARLSGRLGPGHAAGPAGAAQGAPAPALHRVDAARHPGRAGRPRRASCCPTRWSRTGRRSCPRPTRRAGSASSGSTTSRGRCCAPRTTYAGWCSRRPRTTSPTADAGWRSRSTRAATPRGSAGITAFTDLVLDAVRRGVRARPGSAWRWSSPPTGPGTRSTPGRWPGWPRSTPAAGWSASGCPTTSGAGTHRGLRAGLRDRRAGRPAAGPARRRAAGAGERPGLSRRRWTPTGSGTASGSAEDPALLDRVVARGRAARGVPGLERRARRLQRPDLRAAAGAARRRRARWRSAPTTRCCSAPGWPAQYATMRAAHDLDRRDARRAGPDVRAGLAGSRRRAGRHAAPTSTPGCATTP